MMKVAILHDKVSGQSRRDQLDVLVQLESVSIALSGLGHEPIPLAFGFDMQRVRNDLMRIQPDLVFNLVEAVEGCERLIYLAPALLDAMGFPYTGSRMEAVFTTTNKVLAKFLMRAAGIPTPDWIDSRQMQSATEFLPGRYILKSVWEHASVGLDESAVVQADSREELSSLLRERMDRLGTECFAEEYVEGREFNVSLLTGEVEVEALPPAEIWFLNHSGGSPRIVGYAAKWNEESNEYQDTPRSFDFGPEDGTLLDRLIEISVNCWNTFELSGYARVDFRVDETGRPRVLEVNINPCLSPDAGFAAALQRAGIDFTAAVERVVRDARRAFPWNVHAKLAPCMLITDSNPFLP